MIDQDAIREWATKEIIVCDCHTWPTIAEMHDYVEALEKKLAVLQAENEKLRNQLAELQRYRLRMEGMSEIEVELCLYSPAALLPKG